MLSSCPYQVTGFRDCCRLWIYSRYNSCCTEMEECARSQLTWWWSKHIYSRHLTCIWIERVNMEFCKRQSPIVVSNIVHVLLLRYAFRTGYVLDISQLLDGITRRSDKLREVRRAVDEDPPLPFSSSGYAQATKYGLRHSNDCIISSKRSTKSCILLERLVKSIRNWRGVTRCGVTFVKFAVSPSS